MRKKLLYLFKRYKLKDYKFSLVALVTLISILGAVSYTHLDVYKRQDPTDQSETGRRREKEC